ncbi:MAG: VCBS repeat-containing protein, partial [Hyphomicrobiales bacterium]
METEMTIAANYSLFNEASWTGNSTIGTVSDVLNCMTSAINSWAAVLAGSANVNIEVHLMTTAQLAANAVSSDPRTIAAARPGARQYVGTTPYAGYMLEEPTIAYELRTGTNPNGSGADAIVYINTDKLGSSTWIDKNALTDGSSAAVPANMNDLKTVLMHELYHAFGFSGYLSDTRSVNYGSYESPFDLYVDPNSGAPEFVGQNAEVLYGSAVPLDNVYYSYHVLQGIPDLMDAVATAGVRVAPSALDLAIAADLGLGTGRNDILNADSYHPRVVAGAGNDTIGFSSWLGVVGRVNVDGGGGVDTLDLSNTFSISATKSQVSNGSWLISDNSTGITWNVTGVEKVHFLDKTVALRDAARSDISGDGTSDVIWFNSATRSISYYELNPAGGYTWHNIGGVAAGYTPLMGDFNGDGRSDILWS